MSDRYYKLLASIAARKDITGSAKVLLAVIINRIGKKESCWPGLTSLSRDCGMDRDTVIRATGQLVKGGLLEVDRSGRGKVNHYRLTSGKAPLAAEYDQSQNTTSTSRKTRPKLAAKYDCIRTSKEPTEKNHYVGFEKFWESWPPHPRKTGKDKVRKKWASSKLEPKAEHILAVLEINKNSEQWKKDGGAFIPAPLVWLNQERWDCDIKDIKDGTKNRSGRGSVRPGNFHGSSGEKVSTLADHLASQAVRSAGDGKGL